MPEDGPEPTAGPDAQVLSVARAHPHVTVDAGGDVEHNGRVAGSLLAEVNANGRTVQLLDGTPSACA